MEAINQEIHDIYTDKFEPSYNDLKQSLQESGIKWVADNFMKVAFISTSTTALPMALLGCSVPQALYAGVGISVVSSLISYNVDKRRSLRTNPYSYLLSIRKNL